MKTLSRYIIREVTLTSLYVLIALIGLFLFFDLINELGSLGKGNYTFGRMLIYVVLLAPRHAYEFMPIAALIGGMVAMSMLNQHTEYTVMRVGGLSIRRVLGILATAGLLFALATLLVGEYLAPSSERAATQLRLQAKGQVVATDNRSGVWLKDDNSFVNVRQILPDQTLRHVNVYQFDANRRLNYYGYAEHGYWQPASRNWLLSNITLTRFDANSVKLDHIPNYIWQHAVLTPDMLAVLMVAPEQMPIAGLLDYIENLRKNQQKTSRFDIALWTKLTYPFICIAMLIIALPFAHANRRSGGIGIKLFVGIMLGLGFYFVNVLTARFGLLYDWPPAAVATLPSVSLLLFALFLLWRQERR
ncbi:LPS export ABC transporter permease LptG [Chitinimonas sp.]|uniref:LPS export ABC transporter permease LptG n=1 Tax=Chitinimonas sp. TaxID=1934313 RepID=UPI0035AE2B3D